MSLDAFKDKYHALQADLVQQFIADPDSVESLVHKRSADIDLLLSQIWQSFSIDSSLSLVCVGGYGRGELHLYSDIDLLILIPNNSHNLYRDDIAKFLTFLWDIGLEVGHATRDMNDCLVEIDDLSVVTNLLESRLLIGSQSLFAEMKRMIKRSNWSSQSFLVEKQKELQQRHLNFSNTAYNLEPNLKESPGGLRDIQTVVWVAKWYFDVNLLSDLVDKSYLNQSEYTLLKQGQLYLWKVRFALHVIAKRREDRIAFQYQKDAAKLLGYVDTDSMAVEQFMKDYFRTVTKVSRLNDILLQLLEDRILHTQNLNERFVISYGYIQATSDEIFKKNPTAFIEVFLLVAKHNYVRGISASTLRQMQADIALIDQDYYKKRQNNRLFIELLQQKSGVNKALKLMNRYGVLERYIPAFGKITGLMQYDLFHTYTVDQHTLFVIRNLRRFFVSEHAKEFPLCSEIAKSIERPEVLLLAGLFHDIAKGRGGDHAKLGAKDAQEFCQHHLLKQSDVSLISGLVKHHLLMSQVAQKQDLEDFSVIEQFSKQVNSVYFLQLLYLLTVADIRATKEDLWNDWKDALLRKLYNKALKRLQSGHIAPPNTDKQVETVKTEIISKIMGQGVNLEKITHVFSTLPKEYFLRYEIDDILWHLLLISKSKHNKIQVASRLSEHNVVDIFVYGNDSKGLFFKLVSVIEKLGLDIVDAKILTTKDKKAYNTISVLQDDSLSKINLSQVIENEIEQVDFSAREVGSKYSHRHFDDQIKIIFSHNDKWNLTQLELNIIDKQGLLSNIAYIFYQFDINLINARISTVGERVEDIFFISNKDKKPLSENEKQLLKEKLKQKL